MACFAFQCPPQLPVGAQDVWQELCAFALRRACETFQMPVIERLDQLEAHAAEPTWHRGIAAVVCSCFGFLDRLDIFVLPNPESILYS